MTKVLTAPLGIIADIVHYCLLRPINNRDDYTVAKARWRGELPDVRRLGIM